MSNLSPNLFDTDFEQLLGLGRSLLPKYAPTWTDHNLHDPGIMLIELLAWTAEAQTYSLARLRSDERWAYAALLGIRPQGPQPAQGLVWPDDKAAENTLEGCVLEINTLVTADQPQAPIFRLSDRINLTKAKLVGVESHLRDGRVLNHTEANSRTSVGYYPFGEQASSGDRFVLRFQGPLLVPQYHENKTARLALGVRVPPVRLSTLASQSPCSDATEKSALVSRLVAHIVSDQLLYPLDIKVDGTNGLLRTGVILLDLSEVPENLASSFSIEFQSRGTDLVGPPRILCIHPNVLPIVQQQTDTTDLGSWSSGGLPDSQLVLNQEGILYADMPFGFNQPDQGVKQPKIGPKVNFGEHQWQQVADLTAYGPEDEVFTFDPATRQIRFGNGINGKIPNQNISPTVEYEFTAGSAGNLPAGLNWKVQSIGDYGCSQDPTCGGFAALDLEEARHLARDRVRTSSTLVTSKNLEQAAYALPDLQVARAEALPLPDLGKQCSVLIDTRTLVVLRARSSGSATTESQRWLAEVQRQLMPKMPLGERLRVVAPDYQVIKIQAALRASPGYDPKAIEQHVLQMLEKLFMLVPQVASDVVWPLGRAVEELDIRARLRNIDGVAGVKRCELIWGTLSTAEQQRTTSSRFLPLWQREQSFIQVELTSMEAAS